MDGKRRFWPCDTAGFTAGTLREQPEGLCSAEDYLLMQLRLCSGLDLAAYEARGGTPFDARRLAFVRQCVCHGYARFDGRRLALTPAGMIVQNAILRELL